MKKQCTRCLKAKPIDRFGTSKGKPNARAECKDCQNEYQKEWRRRDIEKSRKRSRECMRRAVSTPEGRARVNGTVRKCYHEQGGAKKQREMLARLREDNFFRWKARKSYVRLNEQQLRNLWESQDGCCALTGRVLDNKAEIDHIVPRTRGGDESMENSRWVCHEANQAKHNLMDDEFFQVCHEVMTSNAYTRWIGEQMRCRI